MKISLHVIRKAWSQRNLGKTWVIGMGSFKKGCFMHPQEIAKIINCLRPAEGKEPIEGRKDDLGGTNKIREKVLPIATYKKSPT